MNMKRGLMILSLGAAVALGGFGSGQAFFNSPLAANSHYRPINFGMGYEMYVDLSSLETVKDDGQGWIFKVNLFRSPEDSGNIEGTYTLTYKVSHGQAWLYNDSTHSWQEIPMRKKEIKHNQIADFVAASGKKSNCPETRKTHSCSGFSFFSAPGGFELSFFVFHPDAVQPVCDEGLPV